MVRPNTITLLSVRAFISKKQWTGYGTAVLAVAAALAVRTALEGLGQFYYLPLVPAVLATAMVAGRPATGFAVLLSITANLLLVPREGALDATVNAALFAVVAWLVAEVIWRLRALQARTEALAKRLAGRDRMLKTILASVPVVRLDRSGTVRYLSAPACDLFGVSEASALNRSFSAFVEGFDLSAMSNGSPDERTTDRHWTGRREDGRTFPLTVQFGLMPDAVNGDQATLCLTDLTKSHAADATARQLHAQLNHVWRLNSLGEMAATLAHELNQPLSAATTYLHASQTDLGRAGLMGESANRTIDLAKNQLLRAGKIIRRMRDLLAHETRCLAMERVSSMVEDLSGLLGVIGRERGVDIRILIEGSDDQVRAEKIQIQQAIVNLVRNAVEALAGRSDPRVVISGRALSGSVYEVRVEDNGPGIPADEIDRIFHPLMSTKSEGMGLGLSVTRTIIESHGGVLKVERSVLGGAAFSFGLIREQELEAA